MENKENTGPPIDKPGIWISVAAFVLWGLLPLYWKALYPVSPFEIIAHRVWWALVFVTLFLLFSGRIKSVKTLFQSKDKALLMVLRSLILGANWFLYVWAISSDKVVESSLGYFINPLVNVIFGTLFLRERLRKIQYFAFAFAAFGVAFLTVQYGRLPWIALVLAFSFALYGLLKKIAPGDSTTEFFGEAILLSPLSLGYIIFLTISSSSGLYSAERSLILLIVCSGVVSAIPIILFGYGAKRIPLIAIGFIQYLAPIIMLLLGVFVFNEPFSGLHAAGFICIWIALSIFSISEIRAQVING